MAERRRYRALTGLTYPGSRAAVRRVLGGGRPPTEGEQVTVEAGEIAEGLPPESVPWLLAAGLIEEVADG